MARGSDPGWKKLAVYGPWEAWVTGCPAQWEVVGTTHCLGKAGPTWILLEEAIDSHECDFRLLPSGVMLEGVLGSPGESIAPFLPVRIHWPC